MDQVVEAWRCPAPISLIDFDPSCQSSSAYNIASLGVFMAAAKARSFSSAARQLGVSSSAIGKSVARLEHRLGARLFHRSTRSITLTQEGAAFLCCCHKILTEIELLETEFARFKTAPQGKLRVSLPTFGTLVMPAVTGFMAAYPDIQLDIDFSDVMVDVIGRGYDVIVVAGGGADSRLMTRTLGIYRLILVGSPSHFGRRSCPVVPDDLLVHDCLQQRDPNSGRHSRWPVRADPGSDDVTLPVKAEATSFRPLVAMAEAGLGIACVPDVAVTEQLRDGSLVRVLERYTDHQDAFRAVWPSRRHLAPKTRAFIDFMAQHLFSAPARTGAVGLQLAVASERVRRSAPPVSGQRTPR